MSITPQRTRHHYFIMRHGEATTNVSHLMITDPTVDGIEHGLTNKGKEQCKLSGIKIKKLLNKYNYDLDNTYIYYSDFQRAKESAIIIFKCLFGENAINSNTFNKHFIASKLLRARNYGDLNGEKGINMINKFKIISETDKINPNHTKFNVESFNNALKRTKSFIINIEQNAIKSNENKKLIIMVSHAMSSQSLQTWFQKGKFVEQPLKNGEVRDLTLIAKQYIHKIKPFPLKVMQINFHRAGTTSTGRALDILGMGPIWHTALDPYSGQTGEGLHWWIKHKMDVKIMNKDTNAFEMFNKWLHFTKCHTIMDAPVSLHWKEIFKWYPDCKIIVCVRDFDKWHQSVLTNIDGIFFTWWYKFFSKFTVLSGWLYWYLLTLTMNWNIKNKEKCKIYYNEFIVDVKQIVPKDQLLIYNVKDGFKPLCDFLDCKLPRKDIKFPYNNDGPTLRRLAQLGLAAELIKASFQYIIMWIIVGVAYYYYRYSR